MEINYSCKIIKVPESLKFNDKIILEKYGTNPYFIMMKASGSSKCFCGAAPESSTRLRLHFIQSHNKILPNKETADACYNFEHRCIHCGYLGGTSDEIRRFHLFSAHYQITLTNNSEGRSIWNNLLLL